MKVIAAIRAWCGGHKKLTASMVAVVFSLIPDKWLDATSKQEAIASIVAYILGQGVADHGKEAAKIQAYADSKPIQ